MGCYVGDQFTVVNLLPQRLVLTHNDVVHNNYLNFKINW